jgi:hypothetical protein
MRVGRKSLEGCVPVRVNRLKEILSWDPTDKRERGKTRRYRYRSEGLLYVVEQNVTSRVQLPVAGRARVDSILKAFHQD